MREFWAATGALCLVRIVLGFVALPMPAAALATAAITVAFVAVPFYAIFRAAATEWSPRRAGTLFGAGVALHGSCALLVARVLPDSGAPTVFAQALGQVGLALWTLGLGALVAQLIRDKNLLVPVALFLAGFDVFLIFNPTSLTRQLVQDRPEVFTSVAMSVPEARVANPVRAPLVRVEPKAYVGPADLFFSATFFILLYRHRMRVRETVLWLVPTLVLYLGIVILPTGLPMLPALLPIGAVVLLVNRREFAMSRDEKVATGAVAVFSVGLAALGIARGLTTPPGPPPEPSPPAVGRGLPERAATPGPAPSD